jgi:predicted short-subunit dehydrogenase-like oxidoreductase (DUF2520 family)
LFNISIIGAGNLSTSLAIALEKTGHSVNEIFSRDITHAERLTTRLSQAVPVSATDFSASQSSVFFLAIPDDALARIAEDFIFPEESVVAHTSGTVSLSVLKKVKSETAVFYPLQTFSAARPLSFNNIPLILEAESQKGEMILNQIALSLSSKVYQYNSEQRKKIHLAAVFASNFVNLMLNFTDEISCKNDISLDIFQPLVQETIQKAFELGPGKSQTGPAKRNDVKTMQEHLEMLNSEPELQEVYKMLTENIQALDQKQRIC